ncbi:Beclin 1-associated autophagy-related key regulator [Paramuricea clavata]|uniref:Beclin 1-associated autophagy-related key regulator n=1 Tax=Paramuricea clavata TaxID=317549 RepID=A0A6S7G494_PARCT|nr:Beclin 1-associated autophagy-related key regulator [Paramuricea clavata]
MEEETENDPVVFQDSFCPLCSSKRNVFTCTKCITLGLFYNSRKPSTESYEEKRQRLESIKRLKTKYSERVLQSINTTQSSNELKCNILVCQNKVAALREALFLLKEQQTEERACLSKTTEENKKRRSRLEKLKQQIKTQEKELNSKNAKIVQKQLDVTAEQDNITRLRRIRVDQAQKYLFPICKQKVFPEFGTPPDDTPVHFDVSDVVVEGGESCEKALTEATRTSYVEGRWVSDDELANTQYKILEAFLPADGDYSTYSVWLKSNKNSSNESVPTSSLRSSAFSLTAGLTYTCQLLDLMAFFLDVTLPKDVNCSDFCLRDLSASEFRSAVLRLNTNVMYLCLSQNVNIQMLHPKRTLQNIHACLQSDNIELGRFGAHTIFDSQDFLPSDDDVSSSDEDQVDGKVSPNVELSTSDTEWETVTMDTSAPDSDDLRSGSASSEQDPRPSTTTSLVSSVTALWRWKS